MRVGHHIRGGLPGALGLPQQEEEKWQRVYSHNGHSPEGLSSVRHSVRRSGDMYYEWSNINDRDRAAKGTTYKSPTYPKPWQLTSSQFLKTSADRLPIVSLS